MVQGADPRVLVLGVGNLLWADEGFGVRAVEALAARFAFPPNVSLLDGGTQGLYLLPHVQQADRLLVLDAVDFRLAPGTLEIVRNDDIPTCLGAHKMSMHQSSFQEVLALAMLSGQYPGDVVLIGVQPADLGDYGGSLTPPVKARLPEAVAFAIEVLAGWGAPATPRPAAHVDLLGAASLAIDAYERGRPAADEAFRGGDARFINARLEDGA